MQRAAIFSTKPRTERSVAPGMELNQRAEVDDIDSRQTAQVRTLVETLSARLDSSRRACLLDQPDRGAVSFPARGVETGKGGMEAGAGGITEKQFRT